jgi:hypothetical protein
VLAAAAPQQPAEAGAAAEHCGNTKAGDCLESRTSWQCLSGCVACSGWSDMVALYNIAVCNHSNATSHMRSTTR